MVPPPTSSAQPPSPEGLPVDLHKVQFRGGPFVVALLCFLLPFFNLVCTAVPDEPLSISGIQLVTGKTISGGSDFGSSSSQKLSPEPMAVLALLSVLAGLSVFAIKDKRALWVGLGAGTAGVLFLLLLRSEVRGDVASQGGGMLVVETRFGYVFALLALLAAAGVHGYLLRVELGQRLRQIQSRLSSPAPATAHASAPPLGHGMHPEHPPTPPPPSWQPPEMRYDPHTGDPLPPPT